MMIETEAVRPVFVGFGEAAIALATGWTRSGILSGSDIRAFDARTLGPNARDVENKLADYRRCGVIGCSSLDQALADAHLVFSLVTADQAVPAAAAAALYLEPGAFYLDANACAPDTKRRAAELVEAAGARFVDGAIMGPVRPALHRVPLLISGRHAPAVQAWLQHLDMDYRCVGDEIGAASTIKLLRGIMVKGLEALGAECMLAARRAGVDSEVLDSLDASFPGFDWRRKVAYMLRRSLLHGRRRAVELDEAADYLAKLGLPGDMCRSSRDWQERLGRLDLPGGGEDCASLADRVLTGLDRLDSTESDSPQPSLIPDDPVER